MLACNLTSSLVGKIVFHCSPIFFQIGLIGTIRSLFLAKTSSNLFEKSTGQRLNINPSDLLSCSFIFLTASATSERYCGSSGQVVISSPE
ncbi:hypothetical protein D3C87_1294910 [compost metagenome]